VTSKRISILLVNPSSETAGCRLRWLNIKDLRSQDNKYTVHTVHLPDAAELISANGSFLSRLPYINNVIRKISYKIRSLLAVVKIARAGVVVFGKPYNHGHIQAMRTARRFNAKIISDFCDFHSSSLSAFHVAAGLSDVISAPTMLLSTRITSETGKQVDVIPDYIDYQILALCHDLPNTSNTSNVDPRKQSILWFGLGFSSGKPTRSFELFCRLISASADVLSRCNISIEILSENGLLAASYLKALMVDCKHLDCKSVQWSPAAMANALRSPGFAIIPYPEPVIACEKSPNRIELALYEGKVVISNGKHLPSLDPELASYVRDLPMHSLSPNDLLFLEDRQEHQIVQTRRYLNAKQFAINDCWTDLIDRLV